MAESMRERLERLKNSSYENKPIPRDEAPTPQEKKLLTPETMYMKKMDKVIANIAALRIKMHSGTDQYLSLYHELKRAEADFVALLEDPERKYMDLPDFFMAHVETTKKSLMTRKA